MMRRLLMLCILLIMPLAAQAKPLVADASLHAIAIDSAFTGTSILLFGARQGAGDVVVVVRGPLMDAIIRKKERVSGMFVNRRSTEFDNVPSFYALASTQPLNSIQGQDLLARLGIGTHALAIRHSKPAEEHFWQALLNERQHKGLYTPVAGRISFMGETLFKTIIQFPETIARGEYTAEVYLINDGRLVAMQSTPIEVKKRGFDAFVFDTAHQFPLIYGIVSVMIAVIIGWLAATMLKRT
ncbi:hypothetical protein GC177_03105 [bacterium]|nr:hypothetical protein [bacterium]